MNYKPVKIIISGGGTGGHLFPGIAIAQAFKRKNQETDILFTGTGKEFEKRNLKKAGFEYIAVKSEGLKGYGIVKKIRSLIKIPFGIIHSLGIILRFKPEIVVGMGGYSSGAVVLAAFLTRKKIVLHEQNVIPGITNRVLSKFANLLFVSFENTRIDIKKSKMVVSGNPVRDELLEAIARIEEKKKSREKSSGDPFTILIIGGSQGAHSINMAFIDSLEKFKGENNFFFIHQTGESDEKIVKEAYEKNNINCEVKSFFNNMEDLYLKSNIVICRAGATTIAEVTALGKAAVYIPFPYAADDHQVENGKALVEKNAAEMIIEKDLTGEILYEKIKYFSLNLEKVEELELNSKKYGKTNASDSIVERCYTLLG